MVLEMGPDQFCVPDGWFWTQDFAYRMVEIGGIFDPASTSIRPGPKTRHTRQQRQPQAWTTSDRAAMNLDPALAADDPSSVDHRLQQLPMQPEQPQQPVLELWEVVLRSRSEPAARALACRTGAPS